MSNLKSQLKNLNISKLKTSNGITVKSELQKHARILADCIMRQLDAVYDSYNPKIYQRTYELYNSVYIDDRLFVKVSSTGASLSICVSFDDGAWHTGLDGKDVNTAVLLNEGWQTSGKFKDVPYFGYRKATHFIEKAVEEYRRSVQNPFNVKINNTDTVERM